MSPSQLAAQQHPALPAAPLAPPLAPSRMMLRATTAGAAAGGAGAGERSQSGSDSPKSATHSGASPGLCKVPGCAQPVTSARTASARYRVCELHLRTPAVELDGRIVRFCQKCSKVRAPVTHIASLLASRVLIRLCAFLRVYSRLRTLCCPQFEPVSEFSGAYRSCRRQLEAVRRRRANERSGGGHAGAASASASPPPAAAEPAAAVVVPAPAAGLTMDLERWLVGDVAGGAEATDAAMLGELSPTGAWLWRSTFVDAVAGGAPGAVPPPPALMPPSMPAWAPSAAAGGTDDVAPTRVTLSIKVDGAIPRDLPPTLTDDIGRWLAPHFGSPTVLSGSIQPGCMLLTVDAAVTCPLASAPADAPGAVTLLACLLNGADSAFWAAQSLTIATDGAAVRHQPGAAPREAVLLAREPLPPLLPAAVLSTCAVKLRSRQPCEQAGVLRCHFGGQVIAAAATAAAGAPLRLRLPATHDDGVVLVDWAPSGEDACACEPRAVLLTRHADVAAEVAAAAAEDPRRDALLFALGVAMQPRVPRAIVAAAAAAALRRRMHATATRLLHALCAADDDDESPHDAGIDSLLHAAARCGSARCAQLVLDAAAEVALSTDKESTLALLGAPWYPAGSGGATPLHVAAAALAAAAAQDAAEAAALAEALALHDGESLVAWFSAPAASPGGIAPATPAALAARCEAGVALNAQLARRVRAAVARPEPRVALLAPPDRSIGERLVATRTAAVRAICAAVPPVRWLRASLGYDDPVERAAFEAHAAASSFTGAQLQTLLLISYHVLTELRRGQLPPDRLSREHLLRYAVPQLTDYDQMVVYYGESNAWLRLPSTALMSVLTLLPFRGPRAFFMRHINTLLTAFWLVHFLVSQIIKERHVRALYGLPAPLVWTCNGNAAQIFVTSVAMLAPLRARRMCVLLALRLVLPFIAPHVPIWFVMGDCHVNGMRVAAAPANALVALFGMGLAVWNERRALRRFRAWRAGRLAARAAAAGSKAGKLT